MRYHVDMKHCDRTVKNRKFHESKVVKKGCRGGDVKKKRNNSTSNTSKVRSRFVGCESYSLRITVSKKSCPFSRVLMMSPVLAKLGKMVIEHLQSSGGVISQIQNLRGAVQSFTGANSTGAVQTLWKRSLKETKKTKIRLHQQRR